MNYHARLEGKPEASCVIRYRLHRERGRTLDLTKPSMRRKYGYDPRNVHQGTKDPYEAIRPVAEKAKKDGCDIIEYWSERGPGRNYAVIDHYDVLLEKVDLTRVSR